MENTSKFSNTTDSASINNDKIGLDSEMLKVKSKVIIDSSSMLQYNNQKSHKEIETMQPRPGHFADGYPIGYWKEEQMSEQETNDEFIIYFNRLDEKVVIHIYRMVNNTAFGYINFDLNDTHHVVNYLSKIYTWSHFEDYKRVPNSYDLFKPSKTLHNVEMNTSPWLQENTCIVKLAKKTFNGTILSLQIRANQIPRVVQSLVEYHHTNKKYLKNVFLNTVDESSDTITTDCVADNA